MRESVFKLTPGDHSGFGNPLRPLQERRCRDGCVPARVPTTRVKTNLTQLFCQVSPDAGWLLCFGFLLGAPLLCNYARPGLEPEDGTPDVSKNVLAGTVRWVFLTCFCGVSRRLVRGGATEQRGTPEKETDPTEPTHSAAPDKIFLKFSKVRCAPPPLPSLDS